ncbi:MAG: diaminopimelate epimerase [Bryobacterales bacterium]|nr:diaminopimelate epimerase [Bryobacterales bacterium]
MMNVPFTKAHGAKNDFLLTWREDAPPGDRAALARAICDRYTGIGADGWILVEPGLRASIELYNSDGSKPELSGNGTRCAAAFLIANGKAAEEVNIRTGAGEKHLRLLRLEDQVYWFEMDMGEPLFEAERFELALASGPREVTLVNVGNPQCAVICDNFEFDWRAMGAEIERHSHFPNRTNVSFIRPADEHTIDVRFFERGAGETNSSGTGSTGAVAAAVRRGLVKSPVRVLTPSGPLELRWEKSISLTGPAEIVAEGVFHYERLR